MKPLNTFKVKNFNKKIEEPSPYEIWPRGRFSPKSSPREYSNSSKTGSKQHNYDLAALKIGNRQETEVESK